MLINLNKTESSIIVSKKRPAIVVSNGDATRVSPILQVVPLTTSSKKPNIPTHVHFKRKGVDNIALCEQVTTVPINEIEPTEDWITITTMDKVKVGLRKVFDIK